MKIKAENAPALVAHAHNLCLLAGVEPNFHTGYKLYEKLRRLELKAHRLAERECNGDTIDTDITLADRIQVAVIKLLPRLDSVSLHINGDPRGYALKLETSTYMGIKDGPAYLGNPDKHRDKPESVPEFIKENNFYRDFGGYGILAPEL